MILRAVQQKRVIVVNTDSVSSHVKLVQKYELPFILFKEPNHRIQEMPGTWEEQNNYRLITMGTIGKTFKFDENGISIMIIEKDNTKAHSEQILG